MTELYAKIVTFFYLLAEKLTGFAKEEKGAVDIVAIVVIIGVAVLLAIVFKDALGELIGSLFDSISGNATNVVNQKL